MGGGLWIARYLVFLGGVGAIADNYVVPAFVQYPHPLTYFLLTYSNTIL